VPTDVRSSDEAMRREVRGLVGLMIERGHAKPKTGASSNWNLEGTAAATDGSIYAWSVSVTVFTVKAPKPPGVEVTSTTPVTGATEEKPDTEAITGEQREEIRKLARACGYTAQNVVVWAELMRSMFGDGVTVSALSKQNAGVLIARLQKQIKMLERAEGKREHQQPA
jgi:hypothetical protein